VLVSEGEGQECKGKVFSGKATKGKGEDIHHQRRERKKKFKNEKKILKNLNKS